MPPVYKERRMRPIAQFLRSKNELPLGQFKGFWAYFTPLPQPLYEAHGVSNVPVLRSKTDSLKGNPRNIGSYLRAA